jgi:two-component system, NarL family, sensor kinase
MQLRLRPSPKSSVGETSEIRSALTRFLLVGFASLVLVAIPTVLLFQNIAKDRALKAGVENWRNLSIHLLTPQTTAGVISNDKEALAQIDSVVRPRILDGSIARIKIWDMTGRVLYSDESALIGRVYPLPETATLLHSNETSVAEVSSLSSAENEFERGQLPRKLVEVYTLARASTGQELIYEAYFPTSVYNQQEHELLAQMAPVGLAALIVLSLAQLPTALDLARRVQRSRRSRERLLVHAVAAADHERRQLAQELHDDVIQDLAGVGYALSSLGDHLDATNGPAVERIGNIVRRDVELLRAMVTELYPRGPDPDSLARSLADLGSPLRHAGVHVEINIDEQLTVDETTATLIYRVARESVHNAQKHAEAQNVELRLAREDGCLVLTVVDDGRGFDPSAEPAVGHFGLRLIRDTVAEAGGTLRVESGTGRGTRVALTLPLG